MYVVFEFSFSSKHFLISLMIFFLNHGLIRHGLIKHPLFIFGYWDIFIGLLLLIANLLSLCSEKILIQFQSS